MMKFMFILILLMSAFMAWWLIPVALVLWMLFRPSTLGSIYNAGYDHVSRHLNKEDLSKGESK